MTTVSPTTPQKIALDEANEELRQFREDIDIKRLIAEARAYIATIANPLERVASAARLHTSIQAIYVKGAYKRRTDAGHLERTLRLAQKGRVETILGRE